GDETEVFSPSKVSSVVGLRRELEAQAAGLQPDAVERNVARLSGEKAAGRASLEQELALEVAEAELAKRRASGVPSREKIEYRHAGPSPEAITAADDLTVPPGPGPRGSFAVERGPRGERDFDPSDRFRTPLSNLDFRGTFERVGGEQGRKASERIVKAQEATEALRRDWSRKVEEIDAYLERARTHKTGVTQTAAGETEVSVRLPRRERPAKEQFYADFVDLIERPFDDPKRRAIKDTDTDLGRALKRHDELTENWRRHVINSRRELGIETPDGWGLTEQGYFRHLFLGDIQILRDGHFVGTAETYARAQKMALDILKENPDAQIVARARNAFAGDPTLRVTSRQFWKVVGRLGDSVDIPKEEILADIRGVVGQARNRQKFFGALLRREGFEGYSKAYRDVMEAHGAQLARTQELSKLNRDLQPIIEGLKREGKRGLAEEMEGYIKDLWGTPSKHEQQFGNLIRRTPVLRNHVANPDMAFRRLAQKLTSLQALLRLQFNVRASAVNLLDPLTTLWPYVSTRDFASLYDEFLKPATRRMLRERGVFEGATKLEGSSALTAKPRRLRNIPSAVGDAEGVRETVGAVASNLPRPFEKASEVNRGVGYLYGLRDAERLGLKDAEAHSHALKWARKVEFDNSVWNVPPILRSPAGRLLGQFKGYTVKSLENIATLYRKRPTDTGLRRAARVAKFAAGKGVVGGLKTLTSPLRVAAGLLGYEVVTMLSAQLQHYGMPPEEADRAAEAAYYGAPALIGQDLSGSVAILDPFYGKTVKEKLVNTLGGPTLGSLITLYEGSGKLREEIGNFRGDPSAAQARIAAREAGEFASEAGQKVTPYGKTLDAVRQAYRGEPQRVKGAGKEEVELTPFEGVMRALGFTPLRQTASFDKEESGYFKAKIPAELRVVVEANRERLKMPSPTVDRSFQQGGKKHRIPDREFVAYNQKYLTELYRREAALAQSPAFLVMPEDAQRRALSELRSRLTREMPPPGRRPDPPPGLGIPDTGRMVNTGVPRR
nr:hypothetical protein [Acidobacteriota bacterium]